MTDYSDDELIKLFKDPQGNPNYIFNLITRKYQQKVYWLVRRIIIDHDDTNDVVQNAFIKAWQSLNNFREESKLYTWLYRIATNEALTFLKNKRLKLIISFTTVERKLSESLVADPYFKGDEIQLKFQKAILTLPEKQRIVFNMKYFDVLKYEEMSEILGTSVGALKASYHHAVKKIEKYLTSH